MKTKRLQKGLTLIELVIVVGIIGVLASIIVVSIGNLRSRARATKALGQLSSVIPSMYSCWGNKGIVSAPSSGANICSLAASYGQWPQTAGDLSSYSYGGTITSSRNWFVMLTSETDNQRICCNSKMENCKILNTAAATCSASNPSY